ncbi:MAG: DUF3592 domain-containing protein [Hyphomicrobiaceae bacterium]
MSKVLRKIMLGAGALLAILAVYLLVGPESRKTVFLKRLETEGVVAQAKVLEKHVEEHTSYDNSGSRPGRRSAVRIINDHNRQVQNATVDYTFYVDVEFKTAQGQTVRTRENILGQHFDRVAVGALLPILYHPEAASEASRLRDHALPYQDMSEMFRIMAMFILAVAALLLWFGRPRGDDAVEADDSGNQGWQKAASNRMANVRETRNVPSQAPARRAAAARPAAPKGFGQTRRSARI